MVIPQAGRRGKLELWTFVYRLTGFKKWKAVITLVRLRWFRLYRRLLK